MSYFLQSRFCVIPCLALLFAAFSACSKEGSSSASDGSDIYPVNGHVIPSNQPLSLKVLPHAQKNSGVSYSFFLYEDDKREITLASAKDIALQPDGSAQWAPDGFFVLEPNRAYWWEWADSAGSKSGLKVFYSSSFHGSRPVSPRNGGYLDKNLRSNPILGVSNLYMGPGPIPTYDFQLFDNSSAQTPIAEKMGVFQAIGENQTRYYPSVTLNENQTYYWRARVNAPGVEPAWSPISSFTVTNLCSITSGGIYASYAIEWYPKKCANVLKFTDMTQALGAPNAAIPYANFLSLDYGGDVILEMGATVVDQPGFDMRVHEFVSTETLELFAGPTEAGPWFSLGVDFCHIYCDFDLAWAGIKYARYFRVKDLGTQAMYCHETSGSDIDAVEWITGKGDARACDNGW